MDTILDQAVAALRGGLTVLYPTDTIWGIGCDASLPGAVERVYSIKRRDRSKSMLVLCTASQLGTDRWCTADGSRPTTFILPAALWRPALGSLVADNLPADDGSLGIRVPHDEFCQQLLRRLGRPIVSTSANLSGRPSPACHADIGEELMARVDYCVPPLPGLGGQGGQGSRIVKIAPDGSSTVIRP
ncbi:MAG: L-threonylcarbamoyladenylate synthase [Bacteroidales bacterium]|nr:L-threonylcarbamoyladenylate synthase [Bacteroidales bacterium]